MPDDPKPPSVPETPEVLSKSKSPSNSLASEEYLRAIKNLAAHYSTSFTTASKNLNLTAPTFESEFREALAKWNESMARVRVRTEIGELETRLRERVEQLQKDLANNKKKAKEVDDLRKNIEELTRKREIQHLLDSVSNEAHNQIEGDDDFRSQFTSSDEVSAFVVSVDIRRSTELMLKARSPKLFADFITTLCSDLEQIFKANWAVVDKFTGDGILAFFPDFFSGEDAGYLALRSAQMANSAFERRYKEYRSSFSSLLKDVGLGTGIDFGKVHLVRMAGALTIVGQPVVYACRLGGAPAGRVLLNQPAYEVINERYPHLTTIEESSIEIKSEGSLICYDAYLTPKKFEPKLPEWKQPKD